MWIKLLKHDTTIAPIERDKKTDLFIILLC